MIEAVVSASYPLSPIQEGILFHVLNEEQTGIYVSQIQTEMYETVNVDALKSAWRVVVRRYDMLRASLHTDTDGKWYQGIHETDQCDFVTQDVSQRSRREQDSIIAEYTRSDRKKGFSIDAFPRHRLMLYKRGEADYLLIWTSCHVMVSGTSCINILEEALDFYDQISAGKLIRAVTAKSYREYVDKVKSIHFSTAKAYWKNRLNGFFEPNQLSIAKPALKTDHLQERHTFSLTSQETQTLLQFTKHNDVTINTVVCGGWGIVLAQYSDCDDVVFGSVRAVPREECQNLAGILINTLPLRANIKSSQNILGYLKQIREQQRALREFVHTPLSMVHHCSDVEVGQPLFHTVVDFKYQSLTEYFNTLGGAWRHRKVLFSNDTNYTILLEAYFEGGYLQFRFTYHSDIFSRQSIERLANHYKNTLLDMASNPSKSCSEIYSLSKEEENLVKNVWSSNTNRLPIKKTVLDYFNEQVDKSPFAEAIVHGNHKINYKELDRRSNDLAAFLQQSGAQQGEQITMCCDRGIEAIIAMLATIKCGAAYVPLDPQQSNAYLNQLVKGVQSQIILTNLKYQQRFQSVWNQKIVISVESMLGKKNNGMKPNPKIDKNDLIYVLFTSGTTGQPKGVKVAHRGIIRICKHPNYIHFEPGCRIAQVGTLTFDSSAFEIWGALLNGCCLTIIDTPTLLDADQFRQTLRRLRIDILMLVPSLFKQLVTVHPDFFRTLHYLLLGGEELTAEVIKKYLTHPKEYRPKHLINGYGPTESTILSTYYEIPYDKPLDNRIPIGFPINNTEVYILDRWLKPVPIGVEGELYIGGDGLALGYLNNETLTQESFIAHPFHQDTSSKIYKTGDRVCWLGDGSIVFLGRCDKQVKIRGMRIELKAIENIMLKYLAITDCIVIPKKLSNVQTILCAYYTSGAKNLLSKEQTKVDLQQYCPEYMIPDTFIRMSAFPIKKNGKLDVTALPEPVTHPTKKESSYSLNKVEADLLHIWADVLHLDHDCIHPDDHFFALGGDSIISIQIVARIRDLGFDCSPHHIFENPSIRLLSKQLIPMQDKSTSNIYKPLVEGECLLSPIQSWFFDSDLSNVHYFNQEVTVQLPEKLDIPRFKKAIITAAKQHDVFRLQFKQDSTRKKWKQYYSNLKKPLFFVHDYSMLSLSEYTLEIQRQQQEYHRKINITQGPLMIVAYYHRDNDKDAQIKIIAHHLIVDIVSWRIFLDTLSTCYCDPNASPKKSRTLFQAWINFLNSKMTSDVIANEEQKWIKNLSVLSYQQQQQQLQCNLQFNESQWPRSNTQKVRRMIQVTLNAEETHRLIFLQNHNVSIDDVFFAALALTFSVSTNDEFHLYFDHEVHGRDVFCDEIDVLETMGWFTVLRPLAFCFQSLDDLDGLIQSIQQQYHSLSNKGLNYGLLKSNGFLKALPTSLMIFNYLGQMDTPKSTENNWKLTDIVLQSSKENHSTYALEINAIVRDGILELNTTYSTLLYQEDKIISLMQQFRGQLIRVLNHLVQAKENSIEHYPLSPVQEGILFHSLLTPFSENYFVQHVLTIEDALNVDAFKECWEDMLRYFDTLRMGLTIEGHDRPMQWIKPDCDLSWRLIRWKNISNAEKLKQFTEYLKADRQIGFQFDQPPLIRFALIQFENQCFKFVISFHHILLDGWSVAYLLDEFFQKYTALINDQTYIEKPFISYKNYIEWIGKKDKTDAKNYWKAYLKNANTKTPLSIERNQSLDAHNQEIDYRSEVCIIPEEALDKLLVFSRTNAITLNILIQGALGILLMRYANVKDIVIGSTSSGRNADIQGIERIVGLLISTLPLRMRLKDNVTVIDYLQELQQEGHNSRRYEYSKLTDIMHWLGLSRQQSLFDILYLFENYPFDMQKLESFHITDCTINERTHYKLTITVTQQNGLRIFFTYDPNFFSQPDINDLSKNFYIVLMNMLERPDEFVQKISLLHFDALSKMQNQKIQTNASSVIDLFEQAVNTSPNRNALVFRDQSLSYKACDQQANTLAHHLRNIGVQSDSRVGIFLERSVESIVSMLAILKLEATYVHLDVNFPTYYIQDMLQQAMVQYIVTDSLTLQKHPSLCEKNNARFLWIDKISNETVVNEPVRSQIRNSKSLAYITYTSGSTGTPKGVMISNQALSNFLLSIKNCLLLPDRAHYLGITPFTFDISGFEIFLPLITNGTLFLMDEEIRHDINKLIDYIEHHPIHVIQTTPSYWQLLFDHGWINQSQSVTTALSGGETLKPQLAKQLVNVVRNVWNVYGPTETTIWSTAYRVEKTDLSKSTIPIGRPLANTRAYVLDLDENPLPQGVTGKLYIGGSSLSEGYCKQFQLTQKTFATHQLTGSKMIRLYDTGDLAYFLPDGNLEYQHRSDRQIKWHGQRIECAAIEAVFQEHFDIHRCAVVLNKQLVAFCVLEIKNESKEKHIRQSLRNYLKDRLPSYMIPGQFIFMDTLPLTRHQKIDYQALMRYKINIRGASPTLFTAVETKIAQIWSQVLNIEYETITPQAHFFDYGGDSLTAIEVISAIKQSLCCKINVRDFLLAENLSQLALQCETSNNRHHMESHVTEQNPDSLVVMQDQGSQKPLFLIHPIGGAVFCYRPLASYLGEKRPVCAIQDPGIDTGEFLFSSLDEMAACYLTQIKRYQPEGPYFLAGASFGANVAVDIARQLISLGEIVSFVGSIDGWAVYPAKAMRDYQWFEAYLTRQHQKMNGLAKQPMSLIKKIIELNWHRQQLLAKYKTPKYDFPLTLFKSKEIFSVLEPINSPLNHWDYFTSATIHCCSVPGNHETMLEEPHVEILAQAITGCLDSIEKELTEKS